MLRLMRAARISRSCVGRRSRRGRDGATTIEFALVLIIFLTLVLGMMDLAIGIYRSAVLAQTARVAAREAIVHGELASVLGVWEPTDVGPVSVEQLSHPIEDTIATSLSVMGPDDVTAEIQWLDNSNALGARVQVRLEHGYRPISTFLFGQLEIPLVGSSTMTIAH